MCYALSMNRRSTNLHSTPSADADIEQFLSDNRDEIAAKLSAAREEIERGEAAPLEPLDELLRAARAAR